MIFKRIIKNWKEFKCSDLRKSVKPFFKGDKYSYSSYRSGAETYLKIEHKGIVLLFWLELGRLGVTINGVDAKESTILTDNVRIKLNDLLASKDLSTSERNRMVAQLISASLR